MTGKLNKNCFRQVPGIYFAGIVGIVLINSIALYSGYYYLFVLTIIAPLVYYSLFEFEKLYFYAVFLTPVSVALERFFPVFGFNISIPSEFLLALLLLIIVLKTIRGGFFELKVFTHPISITVIVYLGWMFITSISSSLPLVSLKHFLARCWFVFPLFFLPVLLFRKQKNIYLFFWLYMIPFTFVILYSINKHLTFGLFDKKAANFVMAPFYNDHTAYGAVLALFIPVLYGLLFSKKMNTLSRVLITGLAILFSIALVLSYTRAAWISVLGAGVLGFLIIARIRVRYLLVLALAAVSVLFVYRVEIIDRLSKNKQDSSVQLSDHVKSISNIATDASNRERINRWNSALAMFAERPVLGWGPGTYMFQYAAFQKARDKTIISTNFAEGGNAHSEYIGPLAEQGILGFFTFSALMVVFMLTALKLYYRSAKHETKLLVLISILSLTTYFIHGLLNNYLDTDKASVPFWGFMAIICSLDLYADENKNPQLGGAEER